MPLLRAELGADATYYLNPLWLSFRSRAEAWRDSFMGFAFVPACNMVVSGNRAVVYLRAPDNVTADKLPQRREDWSNRVGGVKVNDLRIVGNCGDVNADASSLRSAALSSLTGGASDAISDFVGNVADLVKLLLVVAVVVYVSKRAK